MKYIFCHVLKNFYLINSCSSWAGRAETIPSKNFVLVNSYGLTGVAPHEFGHCLNLWHTFHGTPLITNSGCQENINGSNCNTCGDYVCDTPADANIGFNGGYNPDITNDMSYYAPNTLDHFTTQQGTRMRTAIANSTLLQQAVTTQCLNITGPDLICVNSSNQYTLINPQNTNVIWTVSANIQKISSSNTSITISSINSTIQGNATITANINGLIISKTIWVGKPTILFKREPIESETCDGIKYHYVPFEVIVPPGTTLKFNLLSPKVQYLQNGNIYTFAFLKNYSGPFTVIATATNSCGTYIFDNEGESFIGNCTTIVNGSNRTNSVLVKNYDVYPNPSSDFINIILKPEKNNLKTENIIFGELFDLQGQSKLKIEIKNNKSVFSVAGLNKGVYILKIENNNEVENHQIIVN